MEPDREEPEPDEPGRTRGPLERGTCDEAMWELWRRGMRNVLDKPAFREAWERITADTDYGATFAAFVAAETEKWGKVVRAAGMKPACTMRPPMPNPACASAPNGLMIA